MPLLAVSALTTAAFLLAYRFAVNHAALRRAKNRAQAGLLELRIFGDEPRIVGRAMRRLLAANAMVPVLMLPALMAMLPFGWLAFCYLQARYGSRPLEPGVPALVTLQLRGGIPRGGQAPVLEAPPGFRVESPAVRVPADGQIAWRIAAGRPGRGQLRFRWPGTEITKSVQAGPPAGALSVRRSRGLAGWLAEPVEARLGPGPAAWVEVRYPEASVRALGLDLPWEVWFLGISGVCWLPLRKLPGLRNPA